MVAAFTGLGIWQLQRRVEKHALIAILNERLAVAPGALPQPSQWNALTPAKDEFRRVSFTATYAPLPDAMVYSAGSAVPSCPHVCPRARPSRSTPASCRTRCRTVVSRIARWAGW